MIAGDEEDIDSPPGKLREKMVKQPDRLHRRNAPVINIPGNNNRIRPVFIDRLQKPLHPEGLIRLSQRHMMQHLSKMQIRNVKKLHVIDPSCNEFRNCSEPVLNRVTKSRNCSEPVLNSYASGDASHPESPDAT